MDNMIFIHPTMQNILTHIEDNLSTELDAELLSGIGHISRTQLYRDFYSLTGHSVKEYIRKRRLSNALAFIRASDFPLADIAYQCGYSSQQALCRAVRQALNMTPLAYRDSEIFYFFPPFRGTPLQAVTVSDETIPPTSCLRFYHSSLKSLESRAVEALFEAAPSYSGKIFGRNGKQTGAHFCYELFITTPIEDGDRLRRCGFVPAENRPPLTGLFASSTVRNEEPCINAAWDYLYSEWLPKSMFEYTGEPYYEEYLLRGGRPIRLKLYLPIRKRTQDTKITLVNDPALHFVVAEAKGRQAEKNASKAVIDFLTRYDPIVVKTSREFYLHKGSHSCTCGVRVNPEFQIAGCESIKSIATASGHYLVLESRVMGDYDRYTGLLLDFASENAISVDREDVFAVYDAAESFDNPKLKMFCRITPAPKATASIVNKQSYPPV